MLKVGYIGLGIMGKPIARNILRAGYPLVVHNRSQGSVNELVEEGAVPAENPAQVARQVDVIFTNLPDSPDVEKVALGKNGIIEGAHKELIFVDNSTIKPATARMIADKLGELVRKGESQVTITTQLTAKENNTLSFTFSDQTNQIPVRSILPC